MAQHTSICDSSSTHGILSLKKFKKEILRAKWRKLGPPLHSFKEQDASKPILARRTPAKAYRSQREDMARPRVRLASVFFLVFF
ncbi:hypothetical protein KSP39_PZI016015 [Platanthera zijinensis]|uniref:Uncharacterized protein n=1 Tax=Platanthera zijinensis TaxID=2320716 RepID=A0AAP0B8J8_9ASPA